MSVYKGKKLLAGNKAEQIGAVSEAVFTEHKNADNPHGVTASQVGAPTTEQFNEVATEVGNVKQDIQNLDDGIKSNGIWNELTEGFDLNNAIGRYKTSKSAIVNSLLNKPQGVESGEVTVELYPIQLDSGGYVGLQEFRHTGIDGDGVIYCDIYTRSFISKGRFGEWVKLFTSAGGTLSGALELMGGKVNISGGDYHASLVSRDSADDSTNSRSIFVQNAKNTPDVTGAVILRAKKDGTNTNYKLFGEHNKPSGYYVGTKDATQYTIAINSIGETLEIHTGLGMGAIVFRDGAIVFDGTSMNYLPSTQASFYLGKYTLATSNTVLNGGTRYYRVL